MKRGRLVILLLEDEEHDIFFVKQATQMGGKSHDVHAVRNGLEAIDYLRGEGQYGNREAYPLPNVIMTDLKMPCMDGFEFLQWVRDHPEHQIIPVIVYTSSSMETDVRKAYRLGANSYIVKPSSLHQMVDVLRATWEYWSRCECPPMVGIG
jgi:CheY-like chemotaxis protein